MSLSVLDMSVSVDGYVADTNDYLGGEDGERLHAWADSRDPSRPVKQFEDEWNAAGAILAGRRTAELMDHWGGSHGGLPIFVPSHRPPPPAARWGYPLVTYVADGIESALAQAQAAAGEKAVCVAGGAMTVQQFLNVGLVDELQIHLVSRLLGDGLRLFEHGKPLNLERTRVLESPGVTHLRFRVVK